MFDPRHSDVQQKQLIRIRYGTNRESRPFAGERQPRRYSSPLQHTVDFDRVFSTSHKRQKNRSIRQKCGLQATHGHAFE